MPVISSLLKRIVRERENGLLDWVHAVKRLKR